jgi:hypothetical protein
VQHEHLLLLLLLLYCVAAAAATTAANVAAATAPTATAQEDNTVIIDVRNAYESAIGHFNPPTAKVLLTVYTLHACSCYYCMYAWFCTSTCIRHA